MISREAMQARINELEAMQEVAWATLDYCGLAIVIMDVQRKILFKNTAAATIIGKSEILNVYFDQMVSDQPAVDKWFSHKTQANCCTGNPAEDCSKPNGIRARKGDETLHLVAVPLVMETGPRSISCCAFYISEFKFEIGAARANLVSVYGLTKRESEIVCQIIHGQSALDISNDLLIGESTVRTHIKRAYQKMDVSCQADLVRIGLALNVGQN